MALLDLATEAVVATLEDAQEIARDLGHGCIGTEHVLIACASTEGTVAALKAQGVSASDIREETRRIWDENPTWTKYIPDADVLAAVGIDLDSVRSETEAEFGAGALDMRRGSPGFTARSVRVIEAAIRTLPADNRLDIKGLVRAIVSEQDSVAVQVLRRLGVDLDRLTA